MNFARQRKVESTRFVSNSINLPNMVTILVGIGLIGVFFALMSVRLILLKNGEFKGTCASQSPFLQQEGVICNVCGKAPINCENKENQGEKVFDFPEIKKKTTLSS